MKRLILSLPVYLIAFSYSVHAQLYYPSFDKKNSVSNARADIDFIKKTLEKEHPNLYIYVSEKDFSRKIDSLKRSIKQPITLLKLRNGLLSVLTTVGDGHISLRIEGTDDEIAATKAATSKTYPIEQFNYKVIQGKLFITGNAEAKAQIPVGTEVLAINDIAISDMLSSFYQLIPSDGYNQSFKPLVLNRGLIPDFFTQVYGLQNSLSFKVKINDSTRVVVVNAVPLLKTAPFIALAATSDFKFLPNGSAYLKVGSFPRNPFDSFSGVPGMPASGVMSDLTSQYASVFWKLSNARATSLILDLRNNLGGDFVAATHFFSYLINKPSLFAKVDDKVLNDKLKTPDEHVKYGSVTLINPQSASFRGKLYVLINGSTFSAASLLAANLQGMGKAVFIGEETGGGRNTLMGGVIKDVVVPHSGMILRFGNVQMETPVQDKITGRGVMPDVPISYTIAEYLNGTDKELEWAKADIEKRVKK